MKFIRTRSRYSRNLCYAIFAAAYPELQAQVPEAAKWTAFGWFAQSVDGNDLDAVVAAFDAARHHDGDQPRVIICNTKMCKGIPFLEDREITHFVRVEPDEWTKALGILDEEKPQ